MARKKSKKQNSNNDLLLSHPEYYSGSLPNPDILAEYEKIIPGSASRILSMAEHQAKHRQSLESNVIRSNIENEKKGVMYAFIITFLLMVWGVILVIMGHEISGYISFFGPVIFHTGNYVFKRYEQYKEFQTEERLLFQQPEIHQSAIS